jgi:serine/threonine protein kinase
MSAQEQHPDPNPVVSVIQIPGFQIKDILGRGGMATVYLAIQDSIGREVALKVLAPHHGDGTFTDRFLREARIVSNLTHPHIITVYDAGVHLGHHYMAMEYIRGPNLKQARDQLSRKEKVRIIKQVAQALDYAGRKGYVHRDIKPENIMLHEDGRAVLTDFGLARGDEVSSGLTITGRAMGTPYYMSPEQTKGAAVDHRSDIYSLGVVLYQALAGRVPYDGPSMVAVGIKHVSEPIPSMPVGLEAFQPIINTCLAKDPEHRYKTAGELLNALEAVSEAELDYIDAKAAALVKAGIDPNATTMVGQPVPASHLKPKASNRKGMYASEPIAPLDITESRDYKALKRRHRRVLLVPILVALSVSGYWFRDDINVIWESRLQPMISGYLPSASKQATVTKTAPATTTASPPIQLPESVDVVASQNTMVTDVQPETLFNDISPEQAAVVARLSTRAQELYAELDAQPENAEKLANLYKSWLKQYPGDPEAHRGMDGLRDWLNEKVPVVIAAKEFVSARFFVDAYKDITPPSEHSEQFNAYERQVTDAENLQKHLIKARDYSIAGALIEPEGANALEEFRNVLTIEPNNLEATQAIEDIANTYLKQAKQQQAASKLPEALTAVEHGLAAVPQHPELLALNKEIKNTIEKQERIVIRLLRADEQFKAGKIIEPKGTSAYDFYQSVLAISPDDPLAKRGLRRIEQHYVNEILASISQKKFIQAESTLTAVQPYFKDSESLAAARKRLAVSTINTVPTASSTAPAQPELQR